MVREVRLGPRRELTLSIETWPKAQPFFGAGTLVRVRFGAIANFEETQRFFAHAPGELLHYLRYASKPSPGRHVVEMEFDRTEARIQIIAGNMSISSANPEPAEQGH